ncbi:hypothetical protein FKM82_028962 [Ascaphus truei]
MSCPGTMLHSHLQTSIAIDVPRASPSLGVLRPIIAWRGHAPGIPRLGGGGEERVVVHAGGLGEGSFVWAGRGRVAILRGRRGKVEAAPGLVSGRARQVFGRQGL